MTPYRLSFETLQLIKINAAAEDALREIRQMANAARVKLGLPKKSYKRPYVPCSHYREPLYTSMPTGRCRP